MYSLKVVGAGLYQVTSAWRQRRCCHGGVPASVLMEHSMVTEEELRLGAAERRGIAASVVVWSVMVLKP